MNKTATIYLKDGRKMNVELFEQEAPLSVENFVKLAKADFYNGLIFHRVIPSFMVQGGGFDQNMNQKESKKAIKGEFLANGVKNSVSHTPGTLSMARTMVKDSATSQFFICVDKTPHLDGQYAGFGRTADEESLKVAIELSLVKTKNFGHHSDVPVEPIVIDRVTVNE